MEVWKDIPDYQGLYQVSNLGRVKSLRFNKEKLLKQEIKKGYKVFYLSKDSKTKQKSSHQLVAMAFLGHVPCGHKIVVDHINNDKLDNRVENLQIITNRENCSKDVKNKTSKYTGVSWDKHRGRWSSKIKINGNTINLGRYKCELAAHLAYQDKLKELC